MTSVNWCDGILSVRGVKKKTNRRPNCFLRNSQSVLQNEAIGVGDNKTDADSLTHQFAYRDNSWPTSVWNACS